MSPVLIGQAIPDDAPDIAKILSGWIDETPWMPRIHTHRDEQGFARDLVARGWVHVARKNDRVVGFLARDSAELHALYLTDKARGQGVGLALLDCAKGHAAHLLLWVFQANSGAQRFYERAGFKEIARSDGAKNDEGLPDIRYEWRRQYA